MTTFLAFIVAIGVLVTVHEFGHYLAARSCGVRVLRFSIGFGKPLFKYQRSLASTEWLIGWLPLGGYVKMLNSRDYLDASKDILALENVDWTKAFDHQHVLAKMWIVFAGPLANLVFAFFCYWGLVSQGEVGLKPIMGPVANHSIASDARLRQGDLIIAINGYPMFSWQDVQWALLDDAMERRDVSVLTKTPLGDLHSHTLAISQLHGEISNNVLNQIGLSVFMPSIPAVVGGIAPGSVAEKVGLKPGDKILSVNGKAIDDWQQLVKLVRSSLSQTLNIQIERNAQHMSIKLVPQTVMEAGQKIGRLGAMVKMVSGDMQPYEVMRQYTLKESAGRALQKMYETVIFTLKVIRQMLSGQASLKAISGPVSIADAAGESAGLGVKPYIGFVALLSISIAVMNLLPIPVLDGGHLLYHMAELIRGKPLSDKVLEIGQRLGIGILGALMLVAFFNDINRYLIG